MPRLLLCAAVLALFPGAAPAASTHRLHDGITAFVTNPDGKGFSVKLTVRDLNLFETGRRPRRSRRRILNPKPSRIGRTLPPWEIAPCRHAPSASPPA